MEPIIPSESGKTDSVIYFFIVMFLITVSFSTFLSNFALYSAIAALLYSRFSGGAAAKFKYSPVYSIMLLFVAANILGLFTSGLGLAGIGKIKNVMAFLAFFLAYEKGFMLVDKIKMMALLQSVNFILLLTAILATAFGLTDIVYFQDFVYWPSKYSGLFEVPITYGEFLVMMQCISLAIILGAKDAFESPQKRGLFLALICANAAALLLTYSRGPWAAMVLAVFALLLFNRYYRIFAAALIVSALAAAVVIYPPVKNFALLNDLNARVMSTLGGYSSGREVIYAAGIAMIKDNPVTGVGIGGVEKNYSDYVRRVEWAPEERKKMVYGHLHNLYLQIYAETGFAGFASFICLCLYVLAGRLIKKINSIKEEGAVEKAFAAGTALAFAAVLVMGLSEYNMFNNEISRILWFYTGMALGERKN
ncbi:MAG TPA: O-antigen ligase family protein [Candidatus Wallbacteria bacterium]|nr:O-antigen ligase family protein [Candidatus Wallbacteria bacterium]